MLFCGGGQGGSARGDGHSALLWPTSAANTSIELMESACRCWWRKRPILPDSGGPGRHRGGFGQRVVFRKRDDDGQTMLVSVYPEGVNNPIPGLFGGRPAAARGAACWTRQAACWSIAAPGNWSS
jgi:5-oxoprolinase (ATP-hydrolysing)